MDCTCEVEWPLAGCTFGSCSCSSGSLAGRCVCDDGWSQNGDLTRISSCIVNERAQQNLHITIICVSAICLVASIYDLFRLYRLGRLNIRKIPTHFCLSRSIISCLSLALSIKHLQGDRLAFASSVSVLWGLIDIFFWSSVAISNSLLIQDLAPILTMGDRTAVSPTNITTQIPSFNTSLINWIQRACFGFLVCSPLIGIPMFLLASSDMQRYRHTLVSLHYAFDCIAVVVLCGPLVYLFWRASRVISGSLRSIRANNNNEQQRLLHQRVSSTLWNFAFVRTSLATSFYFCSLSGKFFRHSFSSCRLRALNFSSSSVSPQFLRFVPLPTSKSPLH